MTEIWRYPLSSVGGERVHSAELNATGVAGDRQYGMIDLATGRAVAPEKDHRWRKALHLEAKSVAGKLPTIVFPDGHSYALNDRSLDGALSDYFGVATAVAAYDREEGHFDFPLTEHRTQHFPLHLLTTASLRHLAGLRQVEAIDSRRFRPSVLIETSEGAGFLEDRWVGRRLRLGAVDLTAREATKRCGMTFVSQPGLEDDPEILRNILRHNKRNLGIYCTIDSIGTIQVGDGLFIED
ncbi:MAG: MOSC domain-containing protein [Bradyrhizobium sp.]